MIVPCLLNTDHATEAFGIWFMTIPHIAIMAGLLLAGNNPNILGGIVGKSTANTDPLKWGFLAWVYDSRYRPAWIWDRGRSKRVWALRYAHQGVGAPANLSGVLQMGLSDWMTIAIIAGILIVVPSTLAFLMAYYTPKVGISCRSFTFLLYMLCQLWLIALWIWNIESTKVDEEGVPETPVTQSLWTCHPRRTNWQAYIWYPQTLVACGISVFTGVGGTLMQVIGVYRNCLCSIGTISWGPSRFNVEFVISINSAEAIHNAARIWKGTGAAAFAFLGLVSFVGWWSQKRLRYQFKLMINRVDENAELPSKIEGARTNEC